MDTARTVALAVLTWMADHPEIAWPIITALVSVVFDRLEKRFPNVTKLLRSVGLDLPGAKRATVEAVKGALARRRSRRLLAGAAVDPEATPVTPRESGR